MLPAAYGQSLAIHTGTITIDVAPNLIRSGETHTLKGPCFFEKFQQNAAGSSSVGFGRGGIHAHRF